MKTLTSIILALVAMSVSADYTTIVMTPSGPVTCQEVNGTMVCR